jgi:hypothetical protein
MSSEQTEAFTYTVNCWTHVIVLCRIGTHMVDNHGGLGICDSHHGKAGNRGRNQLSRNEGHSEKGQLRKDGGQD